MKPNKEELAKVLFFNNQREAAAIFKVSIKTIQRWKISHNIDVKPSCEDFKDMSINDAAKKYNKTTNTIRRWMKEYGTYVPKKNFGPGKLDRNKANQIRNLENTGDYTQQELSKMFLVSQATIGRIINNIYYRVPLQIKGKADIKSW